MHLNLRKLSATLLLMTAQSVLADNFLLGLAQHQELNKEQFIAALYSSTISSDTQVLMDNDVTRRITLKVTAKSLSPSQINNMWIGGMAVNSSSQLLTQEADNMVMFTGFLKQKLMRGDTLSIHSQNNITSVSLNDIHLGRITSDDFFNMLLHTWIGSVPLSSNFRDALLAGGIDINLLRYHDSIISTPERSDTIAQWRDTEKVNADNQIPSSPSSEKNTVMTSSSSTTAAESAHTPLLPEPVVNAGGNSELTRNGKEPSIEKTPPPTIAAAVILNRQLYQSKLQRWVYKSIRYPSAAIELKQEGSVRLSVTIDRSGNVLDIADVQLSQYKLLNVAAFEAINNASPLPKVPSDVTGRTFTFTIPISFKMPVSFQMPES